jgi:hypothetical protein
MAAPKLWKKDIVLKAIEHRGGMTYGQIQQLVVLMAGLDYEERDRSGRRKWRGYWSTTLVRLLKEHCVKSPDGVYRIATASDRPSERTLREIPYIRQTYELMRRAMVAGGRLPPGPFDAVSFKSIHFGPKHVSITFEDACGFKDVRWIHMNIDWPIPAGGPTDYDAGN